jgi:capsule polysaccharide export protein KpsE/RkpR
MARKAETPRNTYLKAQFEFIVTELDLALTFWDIANSTQDERRATRNLEHAKKAYAAAIHFLNGARLDRARRRVVHGKLQQLESLLTTP